MPDRPVATNMRRKVQPCKQHVWSETHSAWGGCGTPYCGGWTEGRCVRCGWYIASCPCGSNNGADTISSKYRKKLMNREPRHAR